MVKILEGMRIVESSAFVAAPLAGMTLAQLGADVIRFDRIGGGLDHRRWPVTRDNRSLFWAGLNKGKRSIAVDTANPRGREIVTRLVTAPGPDAGIFLTNLRPTGWLGYEELRRNRADLIMMSILGDRHGGPQVDYTVNPAVGFPTATGPEGLSEPVSHVLPAWDCITGQKAALGILAAERHRRRTGGGQLVELALKDVALAMLGNLGIIGEVTVNGYDRPKFGNSVYGAYARDFVCADGRRIMVVAITARQWQGLGNATGLAAEFAQLGKRLGRDLSKEGDRFLTRKEIGSLLEPWFATRCVADFADRFTRESIPWSEFRTFKQAVSEDPDLSAAHPMFETLDQPGIGTFLVPGSPFDFSDAARQSPRPAPRLGEHTGEILAEIGYSNVEIASFHDDRIVAGVGSDHP
jgi:2-methylfumaryl-CoA isomerase